MEYPKGSGIKIYDRKNGSCVVRIPVKVTGVTANRKTFPTIGKAKEYAHNEYYNYKLSGKGLRGLSQTQMSEVQLAIKRCEKANVTLTKALDYALPRMKTKGTTITLSGLISEYSEIKNNDSIEQVSKDSMRARYSKILEVVGDIKIADINKSICKEAINSMNGQKRNKLNYFNYFKSLMTYAKSMDYIVVNPFEAITNMEKRLLLGRNPMKPESIHILSVEEVRLLLECARANPQWNMLPNFILQLFCGVRADEAEKLSWSDIRFNEENPYVVIDEKIAKGKRIRRAMIPENAALWFSLCDKNVPIGHKNLQQRNNFYRSILQKLGWGTYTKRKGKKPLWKNRKGLKNVLRHCFGSYHFDLYEDSIKTSNAMGHSDSSSEGVLFTNYRKLIAKSGEGKKYFNIAPRPSKKRIIPISEIA